MLLVCFDVLSDAVKPSASLEIALEEKHVLTIARVADNRELFADIRQYAVILKRLVDAFHEDFERRDRQAIVSGLVDAADVVAKAVVIEPSNGPRHDWLTDASLEAFPDNQAAAQPSTASDIHNCFGPRVSARGVIDPALRERLEPDWQSVIVSVRSCPA